MAKYSGQFFLRWTCLIALAAGSIPLPAQESDTSPTTVLKKAEEHYEDGNYESSKRFVELLATSGNNLDSDARLRYIVLNCRLNAVYENREQMELWLGRLAETDLNFEFDNYRDPPHLSTRWKEVKSAARPRPGSGKSGFLGTGMSEDEVKDRSRFWVGLVPYGVGHFDANQALEGTAYLGGELTLFYLMTNPRSSLHGERIDTAAFGLLGFLGAWGYEVNDLMPELMQRDDFKAEELRYYLSLAPFGVGQAKNQEYGKAFVIGLAQTAFLTVAATARDDGAQAAASLGAVLSYSYGAYDAWVRHSAYNAAKPKGSGLSINIFPNFPRPDGANKGGFSSTSPLGFKLGLNWRF